MNSHLEQPGLKYVGQAPSDKASSENEADAIAELPTKARFSPHEKGAKNSDIYSIHGEQASQRVKHQPPKIRPPSLSSF